MPPGPLAPGEIGAMLVEVGTFVKEPMSGSGQGRAKLPRQRLTCVPSMFDSLGVQVPCTT